MKLQAIGFDLDNTLYDQGQYMRSFFTAAAADLAGICDADAARIEQELLATWQVRTSFFPRLFDEVLEHLGISDTVLVKRLVGLYHAHEAEITLFPGTADLLAQLSRKYRLFLITDGNVRMQRYKVGRLDIVRYFSHIVYTSELGRAKPAQEPYQAALTVLGVAADACIYVGDNPQCDFSGARALGLKTVRVLTEPFGRRKAMAGEDADVAIDMITDLPEVLDDW